MVGGVAPTTYDSAWLYVRSSGIKKPRLYKKPKPNTVSITTCPIEICLLMINITTLHITKLQTQKAFQLSERLFVSVTRINLMFLRDSALL